MPHFQENVGSWILKDTKYFLVTSQGGGDDDDEDAEIDLSSIIGLLSPVSGQSSVSFCSLRLSARTHSQISNFESLVIQGGGEDGEGNGSSDLNAILEVAGPLLGQISVSF